MRIFLCAVVCGGFRVRALYAQTGAQESVQEQIRSLTESMTRTQAALEQSQLQLMEMRQRLGALQRQMAESGASGRPTAVFDKEATSSSTSSPITGASTAAAIEEIRERQAIQETQIAVHEQTKVESASKYPVKVTGLLLFNGFVNTKQVDLASTPTVAGPGAGSVGATVRQTVLGLDAAGPHLFGARSYGDLRVDFDGNPEASNSFTGYSGYSNGNATLLRIRTAHAGLEWQDTEAYFRLDRPILSPDAPTSLTAVAEPALAWSGNLWTWNPQVGVTRDIGISEARRLRLQGALIDVGDAPVSAAATAGAVLGSPPTYAEQSRRPGGEARVAWIGSKGDEGSHLGVGGYLAPHLSPLNRRFYAWAGTLDAKLLLPGRLELTGSFYRGAALGGLGGGAYKDFGFRGSADSGVYYFRPLDDAGGWAQLKRRINERFEANAAFGLDNAFARELRPYAVPDGTSYQNLARNRTYTGNVLYSPSAYLLFSFEYRYLQSSLVVGSPAASNVIGLGAGYKF